MGANLQFTLKEPQPPKHTDKTKKAPFVHEVRTSSSPDSTIILIPPLATPIKARPSFCPGQQQPTCSLEGALGKAPRTHPPSTTPTKTQERQRLHNRQS